jgi:hypothetical protein
MQRIVQEKAGSEKVWFLKLELSDVMSFVLFFGILIGVSAALVFTR